MIKHQKLFLIILALLVPVSSFAARTFYGGVQYAAITYTEGGIGDLEPTMFVARVGERFDDAFAIEGRFGLAISGDSIPMTSVEAEISKMAGIYGIGYVELSKEAFLYGLVGVTKAQRKLEPPVLSNTTDDYFSYGLGLDYEISDRYKLNIEYTSDLAKSELEISALSIGFTFDF